MSSSKSVISHSKSAFKQKDNSNLVVFKKGKRERFNEELEFSGNSAKASSVLSVSNLSRVDNQSVTPSRLENASKISLTSNAAGAGS